jgi:hypothetical protein
MQKKLSSNNCFEEHQITVFKKLIEPIDQFVAKQNEKLVKHPNQKYEYYDFFTFLVYYFTSEAQSLKLLINGLLNKGLLPNELNIPQVPYSTFSDALERFSPDLFRAGFKHLIQNLHLKEIPELMVLGTLYCIDGSQ